MVNKLKSLIIYKIPLMFQGIGVKIPNCFERHTGTLRCTAGRGLRRGSLLF
jgi:hypothetical protein